MSEQPEPTLIEFALFNQWANQKLLEVCTTIDPELLDADIPGSAGSIRKTFRHLLHAEAGFVFRVTGSAPRPEFDWEADPSLEEMAKYAGQLGHAYLEMIQKVSPTGNVHEESDTWSFDYQTRVVFMSIFYHGISHRTDITTFLNRQDVEVPELDVWAYQDVYPERFGVRLEIKDQG